MIRRIVASSMQARLLVVAAAGVMIFLGVTRLRNVPVDAYPEFTPPYVEVQTEALGLSATEVEQLITVPLEADLLNGVAWVQSIRSESVPGLSSIVLVFEPGTDIMRARQMVQEPLTQAHALPNVSKPPVMIQPVASASRVMKVGLSSSELSLIEMSVLARWTIRPRLMGVSGVANVSIWGQRKRQLQVQVDPERLQARGVTLNQVVRTTGDALWVSPLTYLNAAVPGTGGFIDTPNQRLGIRHVLPISSAEDLAKVAVYGEEMVLGDVATVVEDHQPLIGDAIIGDEPGLLLVIEKFPWAHTMDVTRGVEAAIDAMKPGLAGIEFDSKIFRPATFLEKAVENLSSGLLLGMALVTIGLFALLYQWRSALISVVVIVSSLTAAGLVLYLSGVAVDMIVLAGLAIAVGAIVDDAIIDVQNVTRRLRQHRKEAGGTSTVRVILEASLEMRGAIVLATLIIVLAALPAFFMEGVTGAFFKASASSYVLAVVVSMLVALMLTPALSMFLFSKAALAPSEPPLTGGLQRGYDAVLSRAIKAPAVTFGVVGLIAVAGLAVLPFLRQESLLPPFKESEFLIEWEGAAGTSHPEMVRITNKVGRELRAIPGVRNVGAHVGRAVMSDEVVNVNSSRLWVSIDPTADYDETVAAIEEVVEGYPGLSREVMTYPTERFAEVLTGSDEDIVVAVYGEDLGILSSEAERVKQVISKIDGVLNAEVERPAMEPVVEIEVDLAAAERYGIKPGDVRRAAATLLGGLEVGMLFEEQKVFDVVVWGTPETRHSLTTIRELLIDTPGGGRVRLQDVARVEIVPSPNVIRRDGVARRIDITANLNGRPLGSVARDIRRELRDIEFPLEYHAELVGLSEEREAAVKNVRNFAIAAAIGIFLLLQAACGSWGLAFATFLTLPLALVGGVLAALAAGGGLSLGSLAGFLAVFGIAVRNAIMLIKHYQRLERSEGETFGSGLILRGTRERFAPIMTTAVATALAVLPFVLFGNITGYEIMHPMAVVILGGLVTSTVLNLFIVPALYLRFGRVSEAEWSLGHETSPEPVGS